MVSCMGQMTLNLEHMVVLLPGLTSHITQHSMHGFCLLFLFLILVGVELPSCIVVTLSYNAITCFLESG